MERAEALLNSMSADPDHASNGEIAELLSSLYDLLCLHLSNEDALRIQTFWAWTCETIGQAWRPVLSNTSDWKLLRHAVLKIIMHADLACDDSDAIPFYSCGSVIFSQLTEARSQTTRAIAPAYVRIHSQRFANRILAPIIGSRLASDYAAQLERATAECLAFADALDARVSVDPESDKLRLIAHVLSTYVAVRKFGASATELWSALVFPQANRQGDK